MDDAPPDIETGMPFLRGRADFIQFERGLIVRPRCGPSRGAFFTGMYPSRTGYNQHPEWTKLLTRRIIGQELQAAGVHTGLVGKFVNLYPAGFPNTYQPPGWNTWRAIDDQYDEEGAGLDYFDYTLIENGTRNSYGHAEADYLTDVINAKAVDFVTAAPMPFFLHFAHYAPHPTNAGSKGPKVAPRHMGLYADTPIVRRPGFNELDVSDKPPYVQSKPVLNDSTIAAVDEQHRDAWRAATAIDEGIANIVAALEARGILEDTIIVVASDNGWNFGEHRLFGLGSGGSKGTPHQESLQANWWMRVPGVAGGVRPELVTNLDFHPTALHALGARPSEAPDGMSLLPMLRGQTGGKWREDVFISGDGYSSSWTGVYHYGTDGEYKLAVYLGTGYEELYDLTTDPGETNNLAVTAPAANKQLLDDLRIRHGRVKAAAHA